MYPQTYSRVKFVWDIRAAIFQRVLGLELGSMYLRSSRSAIGSEGYGCVAALDSFLLRGVGIYERSFTSECTVLVALAKVLRKRTKCLGLGAFTNNRQKRRSGAR